MEVTKPLANDALQENRGLVVPIYQREYAWKSDLIEGFWDDVEARADLNLTGRKLPAHFIGALILAPAGDEALMGGQPQALVVDGQQRLTTFQLFLGALRQIAIEMDEHEFAASLISYVRLPSYGDTPSPLRLLPTADDRELFKALMESDWDEVRDRYPSRFYKNGNLRRGTAPLALAAFETLREKVGDFVSGLRGIDLDEVLGTEAGAERTVPPEYVDASVRRRLEALADGLLRQQRFVVVSLDRDDDAQVIFESLNSKREPLLAMELVRNNIFHRAAAREDVERLYNEHWKPFRGEFWKEDSPRAKPRRKRIDHFLTHALTALTGTEASLRNLYAEYRAFASRAAYETVEEELKALAALSTPYRELESGDDTPLAWLGNKLAIWEVATATPILLQIGIAKIDEEEKRRLYRLVYGYIVRRAVCGEGSKNLNKNFERVSVAFLRNGVSVETFVNVFRETTARAVYFPTDDQFREAFGSVPIYGRIKPRRIQDIMWELNEATRSKFQIASQRTDSVSVEHVMPQDWPEHWPLPDGTVPDDAARMDPRIAEAIEARNARLHRLGNLTLVTIPLNSSMRHDPWSEKRPRFANDTFALNLELAANEVWDEDGIDRRGSKLAECAVHVWPGLPAYA